MRRPGRAHGCAPDCLSPQGGSPLQEPEELQLLRRRLDPQLAPALAAGEAAPRLAVAAAVHGLARAAGVLLRDEPGGNEAGVDGVSRSSGSSSSSGEEEEQAREARGAGAAFWRALLADVLTDPHLSVECLKPGGDVHRLLVGGYLGGSGMEWARGSALLEAAFMLGESRCLS
jgi:hypothetical protein